MTGRRVGVGALGALDVVTIVDGSGEVLMRSTAVDLSGKLVLPGTSHVELTPLETLVTAGHLRRVSGEPWTFVIGDSGRAVVALTTTRLSRRRTYGMGEAA